MKHHGKCYRDDCSLLPKSLSENKTIGAMKKTKRMQHRKFCKRDSTLLCKKSHENKTIGFILRPGYVPWKRQQWCSTGRSVSNDSSLLLKNCQENKTMRKWGEQAPRTCFSLPCCKCHLLPACLEKNLTIVEPSSKIWRKHWTGSCVFFSWWWKS